MEQTNTIPFAYLHLMKKEGVQVSNLDSETQSLIKDLKQTTQVLINRAKGGEIKVSPQTERKIKNYDRAICEGIYDYLEGKENNPSQEANSSKEDEQLKAIHEKQQAEKGGQVKNEPNSLQDIDLTPNEPKQAENKEENSDDSKDNESKVRIGFWDWE